MRTIKDSLKKSTKIWIKPFINNNSGNIGVIFAISTLPVLMSVGLAVDYSRSSDAKSAMQSATDSAVLAAVLDTSTSSCAAKRSKVVNSVNSSVRSKPWVKFNESDISIADDPDGGCVVNFAAKVDTSVMAIAGYPTMDVSVKSAALAAPDKKIEIAFALDNTASMGDNGMIALRSAANKFVDTMSAKTPSTHLKMGIVPFVAMVNPGKEYIDNAEMSDYQGDADYHGYYLAGQNLEQAWDCNAEAWSATGSGGSKTEQKDVFLEEGFNNFGAKFAYAAKELLGIKAARAKEKGALNKTAATDLSTILATWVDYKFIIPNTVPGTSNLIVPDTEKNSVEGTVKIPLIQKQKIDSNQPQSKLQFTFPTPPTVNGTGGNQCVPQNPMYISHFDLFDRTGPNGVPWKGCVMARGIIKRGQSDEEALDVSASPPGDDPNSKFVPMFWPTDPAVDKNLAPNYVYSDPKTYTSWPTLQTPVYTNVYLAPTSNLSVANNTFVKIGLYQGDVAFSFADLLRYNNSLNGMASMPIIENVVDTLGPNKGCPNEVTPLTNSTSKVKSEIDKLTRWNGGGTVTSEGLMWAWRVLSPEKPYAMGADYTDTSVQKYIILMSDGANYLNEAGPQGLKSGVIPNQYDVVAPVSAEHTAYGSINAGQQPVKTFAPQIVGIEPFNASAIFDKTSADKLLDERFSLACTKAKEKGIKVYTIYFSHGETGADAERAEKSLSDCSGINHIKADDSVALEAAFKKIAVSIYSAPRLSK